jgi:hypothetical protein
MRIRPLLIAALGLGCVFAAAAPASADPWGYGWRDHERAEAWRRHEAWEHARWERARWAHERWEHRHEYRPYWPGAYVPAPGVYLGAPAVAVEIP